MPGFAMVPVTSLGQVSSINTINHHSQSLSLAVTPRVSPIIVDYWLGQWLTLGDKEVSPLTQNGPVGDS